MKHKILAALFAAVLASIAVCAAAFATTTRIQGEDFISNNPGAYDSADGTKMVLAEPGVKVYRDTTSSEPFTRLRVAASAERGTCTPNLKVYTQQLAPNGGWTALRAEGTATVADATQRVYEFPITRDPSTMRIKLESLCERDIFVDWVEVVSGSDSTADKLAFAPPALTDPVTVNVPANPPDNIAKVQLSSRQDAIIKLPATEALKGVLRIEGGNDIVVKGGLIHPNPQRVLSGMKARAISPLGWTGTLHIEGVKIEKCSTCGQYDALEVWDTEQGTLQLVNNRWLNVNGNKAQVHGDVIQTFDDGPVGLKALRIDKMTASSNYQGLQLYDWTGSADIRRLNMKWWDDPNYVESGSSSYQFWYTNDNCRQTHVYKHTGVYYAPRNNKSVAESVWPGASHSCEARKGTDAISSYGYWPTLPNLQGKIYKGLPPNGDYVKGTEAGLNYVSPGYR